MVLFFSMMVQMDLLTANTVLLAPPFRSRFAFRSGGQGSFFCVDGDQMPCKFFLLSPCPSLESFQFLNRPRLPSNRSFDFRHVLAEEPL